MPRPRLDIKVGPWTLEPSNSHFDKPYKLSFVMYKDGTSEYREAIVVDDKDLEELLTLLKLKKGVKFLTPKEQEEHAQLCKEQS